MSWQKCPLCSGTGNESLVGLSASTTKQCTVCLGQKIIHTVTGSPPRSQAAYVVEGGAQSIGEGLQARCHHGVSRLSKCQLCEGGHTMTGGMGGATLR